jgi:nucleotidyltransferase substrate binding protein (TIGR01987 family)
MTRTAASDNLTRAVAKLEAFVSEPILTERDRAGIIQAFEFSFELAWKAIQKYARTEGVEAASPRRAIEAGIHLGLIGSDKEATWLSMMADRNLTTHTYQEAVAQQVCARIVGRYTGAFRELIDRLTDALPPKGA